MSSMNMAYRSLSRRKGRTVLTVSGIVVGVAMLLVLLSLAAGTSTQASSLIRTLTGADITVVNSTSTAQPTTGGGFGRGGFGAGDLRAIFGDTNVLNQTISTKIESISGVYAVSPQLSTTGFLDNATIFLFGIEPSSYANITGGLNIVSGSALSSSSASNDIVVGSALAQRLNLAVGSVATVQENVSSPGTNFTVVGIYSSSALFLERGAYIPLSTAQKMSGENGLVSEFFVKASSPNQIAPISSTIASEISGVTTITPSTFATSATQLSNTLTSFFTLISLVALLAGAFGVINTMMMSISEQTREIGTLRAIGAQKGQVMRIFLGESLFIGLIGAMVGVAIGIIVAYAIPLFTGGVGIAGAFRGALSPVITPYSLILSLSLGILVGIAAGIYPAWRASRMNPVEALRHV